MPASDARDATRRFSDRAGDYERSRPTYPAALLGALAQYLPASGAVIADLGAGTGISTDLLLRSGATVHAVEPNAAMRAVAERRLGDRSGFQAVDGVAAATTLSDASVHLVTAGQAFHWFDLDATRRECLRILVPSGAVALFWNLRRVGASPFMRAYEALLLEHGTDYRAVSARHVTAGRLARFFGGPYATHTFTNEQVLDAAGLVGRLRSSSYLPGRAHLGYGPMLDAARRLFEDHQESGIVRIVYDTELSVGRLAD